MNSTLTIVAPQTPAKTSPVKYLNKNWTPISGAGHWLFGWRVDRQIGFRMLWTDDETLAVTDNGEIAAMLGLGESGMVGHSHIGAGGYQSCGATDFDSILQPIPSDATPVSSAAVRFGNTRKGGVKDAHRDEDGAILRNIHNE